MLYRIWLPYLPLLLLGLLPLTAAAGPTPKSSATITVNSLGDDADGDFADGICDTGDSSSGFTGECTLKAAITTSNGFAGPNMIVFDVGAGFPEIVTSGLPDITKPVTIDGRSGGADKVVINGMGTASTTHGLYIMAGDVTILDLIIHSFGGTGITMTTGEDNVVSATWIGVDATGASKPNGGISLFMESGGHMIGCFEGGPCGNVLDDVGIFFSGGITLVGNLIGVTPDATTSLGSKGGISLLGAMFNTITSNLIGGGGGNGITLGAASNENVVEDNYIGMSFDNVSVIPNKGDGIHIDGSFENVIRDNIIVANGTLDPTFCTSIGSCDGIDLRGASAKNEIYGNFIGLGSDGRTPYGNAGNGILLSPALDNTIGGAMDTERNFIGANGGHGILLESGTEINIIEGNFIGTDSTGTTARGNAGYGVAFVGAPGSTLGGDPGGPPGGACTGPCNLISGNTMGGILLDGTTAGVGIAGNGIGIDATGGSALPNGGPGIMIDGASDNTIGTFNTIAFNAGPGIYLKQKGESDKAYRNSIIMNAIHSNDGIGIDFFGDGPTPNLNAFSDGPNKLIHFPVIESATITETGTDVSGFYDTGNGFPETFTLEFFANTSPDPSGYGEGETPLEALEVTTNDTGYVHFDLTIPSPVSFVTGTARDDEGNTSEFSKLSIGIVVTVLTDQEDADLEDGICDVDLVTAGEQCTLRAAIQTANAKTNAEEAGMEIPDEITFNITPTCGTCSIKPLAPLPVISDAVIIDGSTQEGASCGSWPPALVVELDGTNTGENRDGLLINSDASGSTIRGLVINRFKGSGIKLDDSDSNTIQCNYIGTNLTGTAGRTAGVKTGNNTGIEISGRQNVVGDSTTAANRNLISANNLYGIWMRNASSDVGYNRIVGNLIGTDNTGRIIDPDGTPGTADDLGNGWDGIFVENGAAGVIIGGLTSNPGTGAGNVISGNGFSAPVFEPEKGNGIRIEADHVKVRGNRIGVSETDTLALGNFGNGIMIYGGVSNKVGNAYSETNTTSANMIAFNQDDGVRVQPKGNASAIANSILGNSIFNNGGLGIDLGDDTQNDVTPNDDGDIDNGANTLLNFPVLENMNRLPSDSLSISYRVPTDLPARNHPTARIEFFANNSCDPSDHGEGRDFLGAFFISTNNDAPKTITLDAPRCRFISATLTDPEGSTSELASCQVVANECLKILHTEFLHQPPDAGAKMVTGTTTDGNEIEIVTRVLNEAASAITVKMRVTETNSGRDLTNRTNGALPEFTFEPDEEKDVSNDWDTSGFAWETGGDEPGDQEVEVAFLNDDLDTVASKTTGIHVNPRPVVLIHDVWDTSTVWNNYLDRFEAERTDWDIHAITDIKLGLKPTISGGPGGLALAHSPVTIAQNAETLASNITKIRNDYDAHMVDIVAHGAGGLIARQYIQSNMPDPLESADRPVVNNLVMLGSPNEGTPCADLWFKIVTAPADRVLGWTSKFLRNPLLEVAVEAKMSDAHASLFKGAGKNMGQITTEYVKETFNKTVTDQKDVAFYAYAGRHQIYTCLSPSRGDDFVPFVSAGGKNTASLSFTSTASAFTPHQAMLTSEGVFGYVKTTLAKNVEALTSAGKGVASKEHEALVSIDPTTPVLLNTGILPVLPGEATELEIPIAGASQFGVSLFHSEVASQLLDPSGSIVDDTTIAAGNGSFRTHAVDQPIAGEWLLSVTHTASSDTAFVPYAVWAYDHARTIDLTVSPLTSGGGVAFDVTFEDAQGLIPGAEVSVTLVPADSLSALFETISLDLFDDGAHGDVGVDDGHYANFVNAITPGVYHVSAWAEDASSQIGVTQTLDLTALIGETGADIQVALNGPTGALPATPGTYTAYIWNAGPDLATNATLSVGMDDIFSVQAFSSDQGTCTAEEQSVTCTMSSLAIGDTASVEVEAFYISNDQSEPFEITAFGAATETDWNASNNEARIFIREGIFTSTEDDGRPLTFQLHPNYPNPFNPATTIAYDVKSTTHVRLTVYNLLGQVVETLVDDIKAAGRYETSFDASGLSSGMYLYQIEMGEFKAIQRMVLMK